MTTKQRFTQYKVFISSTSHGHITASDAIFLKSCVRRLSTYTALLCAENSGLSEGEKLQHLLAIYSTPHPDGLLIAIRHVEKISAAAQSYPDIFSATELQRLNGIRDEVEGTWSGDQVLRYRLSINSDEGAV